MINKFLSFCDRLVEEHKAVRRTLVIWAALLISYVTFVVLEIARNMTEVNAALVSFYTAVTALLTAVIGFYQWSREKDDR